MYQLGISVCWPSCGVVQHRITNNTNMVNHLTITYKTDGGQ